MKKTIYYRLPNYRFWVFFREKCEVFEPFLKFLCDYLSKKDNILRKKYIKWILKKKKDFIKFFNFKFNLLNLQKIYIHILIPFCLFYRTRRRRIQRKMHHFYTSFGQNKNHMINYNYTRTPHFHDFNSHEMQHLHDYTKSYNSLVI